MAESDIENKLEKFCTTQDTKFLNNIDEITKLLLIDVAYSCLYQKYGNMQLATKVLEYYGKSKISQMFPYIIPKTAGGINN